uniref:Uncharacterized protein n=1 Tax=Tetradesmus obliquus TaxID=3088 RepID=A0A383W5W7_TETOB
MAELCGSSSGATSSSGSSSSMRSRGWDQWQQQCLCTTAFLSTQQDVALDWCHRAHSCACSSANGQAACVLSGVAFSAVAVAVAGAVAPQWLPMSIQQQSQFQQKAQQLEQAAEQLQ